MRTGIAYKLTFPNGKVYIGITREPLTRRIQRHIVYARAGRHFSLSAAIRKHGEHSFEADVIGSGSWDELKAIEVRLIREHQSLGKGGYNMTAGGDGSLGVSLSSGTREKISASLTGRTLSDIHRQRVGEAQRGKSIPEDVREKMRQAAKRRVEKGPMSEQQRQKIRDALQGRKIPAEVIARRVATRFGR